MSDSLVRLASCSYSTSRGGRIDLASAKAHVGYTSDLRESEWDYEFGTRGMKSARRSPKAADVDVCFRSKEEADRFLMSAYSDTEQLEPGTLSINGWSQKSCVVKAKPDMSQRGYVAYTVTFALLDGKWSHSYSRRFGGGSEESGGLDYDFGYPYDLGYATEAQKLDAPGALAEPAAVRIRFDGPCSNPWCIIAGNRYEVDATAADGCSIVLDGKDMRAFIVWQSGEETDVTASALRGTGEGSGEYAFERLPYPDAGSWAVSDAGSWPFSVTVYETRGEPPWSQAYVEGGWRVDGESLIAGKGAYVDPAISSLVLVEA